jgi:hypothetical protein
MADSWFVNLACAGLEMGHRCIAATVNPILIKNAPGLAIDAEPRSRNDSMREAMSQFRRALPGLRTLLELSADDRDIAPWTLGYINGSRNLPYNISVAADWRETDPAIFDFLSTKRCHAKPQQWQELVVEPIEQYIAENRAALVTLLSPSGERSVGALGEASPSALPDHFFRDEDGTPLTGRILSERFGIPDSRLKEWRENGCRSLGGEKLAAKKMPKIGWVYFRMHVNQIANRRDDAGKIDTKIDLESRLVAASQIKRDASMGRRQRGCP